MVKVDPFIAPIPRKILNDPELRPFFEYFVRWAHDIWIRSGGGDDAITSTQNRDIYDSTAFTAAINELQKDSDYFSVIPQSLDYNPISVSGIYQANPYDWINAKNGSVITLPDHGSLIIRNGDGSLIKFSGSKNINGSNEGYLRKKGTSIHLKYFPQDNEWFVR